MKTKTEILKHLTRFKMTYQDFLGSGTKTLSSFKATREYRDEFLNASGVFQTEEAYNATAMLSYMAIVSLPKAKILDTDGVWELMLDKDKEWIREAWMRQIIFFTKNGTAYEKITGQSVQTGTYNFQVDTSRNILTSDVLGTFPKMCIDKSEISKYTLVETVEDSDLYIQNTNKVIQFMGDTEEAKKAKGSP